MALPDEVFALYAEAKQALAEQRINAELERGFEKRLEGMREELGKNGDAQKHRTHIVEKILTLACPRCGQAFLDYNGCVALTCSRAGCGAGFCGFCLEVQRCHGISLARRSLLSRVAPSLFIVARESLVAVQTTTQKA